PPPAPADPWAVPPPGAHQPWGSGAPHPGAGQIPGQYGVPGQYGAPGQYGMPGYPGYPQPSRSLYTNGLAIAALVVSFLCYFGIIAIGLGAAALVQIKRTGERGKAMAVSAIVIGSAWLVLLALVLVVGGLRHGTRTHDSSGDRVKPSASPLVLLPATSPLRLNTGECFNLPKEQVAKEVPCSEPHEGEVFWTGTPSEQGDDYPAASTLETEADQACTEHVDEYVMDTWTLTDAMTYRYYYPDRNSWHTSSGRRFVCLLGGDAPTTGSVRKDATNLTKDQQHLLAATNQFDRAWSKSPDEGTEVKDDPEAFRTWAGKMAEAADRQAALLGGVTGWADADKKTVDRLVTESRTAAQHFRAAAKATDGAAVEKELHTAFQHLGDDLVLDLRRQLGLATQDQEPGKHPSDQVV
uniref:DUF4190 domain-containing protein n=1 Tax=Kitasatospora phosalacinea TaxID=2065 RepID=UPI0012FEAF31